MTVSMSRFFDARGHGRELFQGGHCVRRLDSLVRHPYSSFCSTDECAGPDDATPWTREKHQKLIGNDLRIDCDQHPGFGNVHDGARTQQGMIEAHDVAGIAQFPAL